jgi:hypothetical protein
MKAELEDADTVNAEKKVVKIEADADEAKKDITPVDGHARVMASIQNVLNEWYPPGDEAEASEEIEVPTKKEPPSPTSDDDGDDAECIPPLPPIAPDCGADSGADSGSEIISPLMKEELACSEDSEEEYDDEGVQTDGYSEDEASGVCTPTSPAGMQGMRMS